MSPLPQIEGEGILLLLPDTTRQLKGVNGSASLIHSSNSQGTY